MTLSGGGRQHTDVEPFNTAFHRNIQLGFSVVTDGDIHWDIESRRIAKTQFLGNCQLTGTTI